MGAASVVNVILTLRLLIVFSVLGRSMACLSLCVNLCLLWVTLFASLLLQLLERLLPLWLAPLRGASLLRPYSCSWL